MRRRGFLTGLVGMAAVALAPLRAFAARPQGAFDANNMGDALKSLLEGAEVMESADITIKAPDIAENGAVVPVTVDFKVAGAESVSIIAENNPNPLAASFALTPSSGGSVSTRIKMGKTSKVHAIVKAGGKLYGASKEVKVTIGGCGG